MDKVDYYSQIRDFIVAIKSYKEGFFTNLFIDEKRCNLLASKGLLYAIDRGKCILILFKDHDFYHVYHLAATIDVLDAALKNLAEDYPDVPFTTDLIGTSAQIESLSPLFNAVGFSKYIQLHRMNRIKGLEKEQEIDDRVKYAIPNQAAEVYGLLEQYFDRYCEQIPLLEEVQKWVSENCVAVITEQNKIIGFVIFEINGVTSYLRYWFTNPDYRNKKIGSALLRYFFHESRHTQRQLFWVINSNENAIMRYKHYGFGSEQLFDQVMIKNIK